MGIRPFVAIRQDLSESAPNILESQMNGLLVGPAVQEENEFDERVNVSSIHGSIAQILDRASTGPTSLVVAGLNAGSSVDFDTLRFGAKEAVVKIDPQGTYAATIKSDTERHILKVDLSTDSSDGKVTIDSLLRKGAEEGDALKIKYTVSGNDKEITTKIREFNIVDNSGVKELYITLWIDIDDSDVTESTVLTLEETKEIFKIDLDVMAPLTVTPNLNTGGTTYSIDNSINPDDGAFTGKLYVYIPHPSYKEPNFSNRIISTKKINTLSNYNEYVNVYKITDGNLYNFFIANRLDIANNIFEVNTENYEEMLGKPTKNNKLSYAMKLIAAEVPGASMKVYVTESDKPEDYVKSLEKIATSEIFYSVTPLTDNESVLNSLVGMVEVAATDTIAKWKMGIMCPRVPHFNKKLDTDVYTITQIGNTTSYYVESVDGGFLTVGARDGDVILGSNSLKEAEDSYYDKVSETYSKAAYAKVDSVVTDKKLVVSVFDSSINLHDVLNGQNLILGTINRFDEIRKGIKDYLNSIMNHGIVSMFPDKYYFTVEEGSVLLPGYYAAAVLNGAIAHLPPQQGVSNMSFNSIDRVVGSSFEYTDGELDEIASAGALVVLQESYSSRPYILRQLTTDMRSLESMEINKVRCLDYATLGFASVLQGFVGKRNVTKANIRDIRDLLEQAGETMILSTKNAFLGSVITWFKIIDVFVPTGEKDAITAIIDVETPTSLNKIRLFVKSGGEEPKGAVTEESLLNSQGITGRITQ